MATEQSERMAQTEVIAWRCLVVKAPAVAVNTLIKRRTTENESELENELESELDSELDSELENELEDELESELGVVTGDAKKRKRER